MRRHRVHKLNCPDVPLVALEMQPPETGDIRIAGEVVAKLSPASWVVIEVDRPRLFDCFAAMVREFRYDGVLDRDGRDDTPDLKGK